MARRRSMKSARAATAVTAAGPRMMVAAEEGTGTLVTSGFITITLGEGAEARQFELRGTVGAHLKVEYHREFADAIDLGTIPQMIGAVAGGLGVTDAATFQKDLESRLEQLKGVPGLAPVADMLSTATVKVTDLGIDTQIGKYTFGFGVDLSASHIEYAGVKLSAFGLLFTYTASKA